MTQEKAAEFLLHGVAESGNSYKPALMLELCGADWRPVFVDYFAGQTRAVGYRELNEMAEIPVLEHGGRRFSQSGVILDYLAWHFGRFGWSDESGRREILRWLLWDNHKLTSYTATLRYLLTFAGSAEPAVVDFLRGRSLTALGVLERRLTGRDWVAAAEPTIADLSICGYLFWPQQFGVDWEDLPAIAAWLERIKSLPRWQPPEALLPIGFNPPSG